jgi:hypothetical protein
MDVRDYTRVVCSLLDIPVYENKATESLHLLFSLFSEFKQNPAFAQAGGPAGLLPAGSMPLSASMPRGGSSGGIGMGSISAKR